MATESAYRSSHPKVREWWEALNADRFAFQERCTEITSLFPGFRAVTSDRSKGQRLVGIVGYDETGPFKELLPPPSPAWRLVRKDIVHYVPYRNHLKDEKLLALFDGVSWKMTTPPAGMPLEVMVDGRWYTPGMFQTVGEDIDDVTVWISWGIGRGFVDPDPELRSRLSFRLADADDVNQAIWIPAKLSEFYAAQGR